MHIGIASPLDIKLLSGLVEVPDKVQCTSVVPYISLLIQEIAKHGHRLSIFTFSFDVDNTEIFLGENITLYICPMRKNVRELGLSFYKAERRIMKEMIERENPEIVHAHWTYEYALAAISASDSHIITAHDAPWGVFRYAMNIFRIIKLLMAYRVSFSAKYMTAVSPFTERQWKTLMLYRGTMDVIGNGLPEDIFIKPSQLNDWNEVPHECVLASINMGWGRIKNSRSLIKAFKRVRNVFPNAHLLLFGQEHGEGEEAHKWAKKNGLEGGIQFLGIKEHNFILETLKSEVDLYVHPARQEQCSLAILEAMAVGVPVIGGENSGGVPWQLGYGKYGTLVNINSPIAISKKIIEILDDKKKLSELSMKAYKGCTDQFLIENVANKYIDLYTKLLLKN
jgi:glycosyltransferase involved in cell wall biosynthesis